MHDTFVVAHLVDSQPTMGIVSCPSCEECKDSTRSGAWLTCMGLPGCHHWPRDYDARPLAIHTCSLPWLCYNFPSILILVQLDSASSSFYLSSLHTITPPCTTSHIPVQLVVASTVQLPSASNTPSNPSNLPCLLNAQPYTTITRADTVLFTSQQSINTPILLHLVRSCNQYLIVLSQQQI